MAITKTPRAAQHVCPVFREKKIVFDFVLVFVFACTFFVVDMILIFFSPLSLALALALARLLSLSHLFSHTTAARSQTFLVRQHAGSAILARSRRKLQEQNVLVLRVAPSLIMEAVPGQRLPRDGTRRSVTLKRRSVLTRSHAGEAPLDKFPPRTHACCVLPDGRATVGQSIAKCARLASTRTKPEWRSVLRAENMRSNRGSERRSALRA